MTMGFEVKYELPRIGGKDRPTYEGELFFHDNVLELVEHEKNRRIPYSRIYYIDTLDN